MHFDGAYNAYFDFGNHTEKVEYRIILCLELLC